jgi:hypothetical protein
MLAGRTEKLIIEMMTIMIYCHLRVLHLLLLLHGVVLLYSTPISVQLGYV